MIVKVKLQGSDVTKAVIADSLKTLKVKAQEKLDVQIERFVLGDDGTAIDEDAALEKYFAIKNNNLVLFALRIDETFSSNLKSITQPVPAVAASTKSADGRALCSILIEKRNRNEEKELAALRRLSDQDDVTIQQEIVDEERRVEEAKENTIKELRALRRRLEESRACVAKSLADKERKEQEFADSLNASKSDFSNLSTLLVVVVVLLSTYNIFEQ